MVNNFQSKWTLAYRKKNKLISHCGTHKTMKSLFIFVWRWKECPREILIQHENALGMAAAHARHPHRSNHNNTTQKMWYIDEGCKHWAVVNIWCIGEHVRFEVRETVGTEFRWLTFNGLVIVTVSIVVIGGTAIVAGCGSLRLKWKFAKIKFNWPDYHGVFSALSISLAWRKAALMNANEPGF